MTACDISPVAIKIARENAEIIGLPLVFHVADAQTLVPIENESFDIVFATDLGWYENIRLACQNWYRVLRPGGRLLIDTFHPLTSCLVDVDGHIFQERSYNDRSPDYRDFNGTPLSRQHGGWGRTEPIVEFHHTLADIMSAALDVGFGLKRIEEPLWKTQGALADLPGGFTSL